MNLSTALSIGVLALSSLGATQPACAATRFKIEDLGAVVGRAINSAGQIGGDEKVDVRVDCVLLDHGVILNIGGLGGSVCQVNALNDAGAVVGTSDVADASGQRHAYIYQNGVMSDLDVSSAYVSDWSAATAINNAGEIVGNFGDALANSAFTFKKGQFRQIPKLAEWIGMLPTAVNDRGQVAGTATAHSDRNRAFLFSGGKSIDLGSLDNSIPNSSSAALAMNSKSQIVGWASGKSFFQHAMLFQDGVMSDLGTIPPNNPFGTSMANGINDRGSIVGSSYDGDTTRVAFLVEKGVMSDLNLRMVASARSQWHLDGAISINNSGQIIGVGHISGDSVPHYYLATPNH